MVIATSYPFLGIFWSMLIFFVGDLHLDRDHGVDRLFRRHDLLGWGEAGWTILIIVLPWLGIPDLPDRHHSGMSERRVKEVQANKAQFDEYVRTTAGAASEIEKAKQLLDGGAIDQPEFDAIKPRRSHNRDTRGLTSSSTQPPTPAAPGRSRMPRLGRRRQHRAGSVRELKGEDTRARLLTRGRQRARVFVPVAASRNWP